MFESRDYFRNPYTDAEMRVVEYLHLVAPDIGGGDDPLGFIIASHKYLLRERRSQREAKAVPRDTTRFQHLADSN